MSLTELKRVAVRPRGGVVKVGLASAEDFSAGGPDPASGFADWTFREDRATYEQERVGEPTRPLTRHRLVMEIALNGDTRRAVDELRAADGVVARVETASGEHLTVGWSERFGVGYPLRVTALETTSGAVPGDYPTVKITLECYD